MNKTNLYNNKSIEHLEPREFTRHSPGVYAGDTTYATQLLFEIVANAIDEFAAGHGNRIYVTLSKNGKCSVEDNGQGFIINEKMADSDETILQAAFDKLNTSGKFTEDGAYGGTSLGKFGIGAKLTTFLSHWLTVRSTRDGKFEEITFNEGIFANRQTGVSKESNGTKVIWQPSEEFFTNITCELNKVKEQFETLVCLYPGLTIELDVEGEKIVEYFSRYGLNELVDKQVKDREILTNRLEMKFAENKYKMEMVLTYTDSNSLKIIPYVNGGLTEAGPHITQVKTVITREFNKFFKEKKWIKSGDSNLTGDDIQEGMYIVFNITVPSVSYDAQVKTRVTKIETALFTSALAENIQYWLINNEKEVKEIFDKAALAKKAREAAKKAREQVKQQKKEKQQAVKVASKLADCSSKNRNECEVFIVEGDSAAGLLKLARDNKFQAVFPIRGKMLNTHKEAWSKIMANAEIITLFKAFGLDWDPVKHRATFDEKKMRYGKIILASDADVDGAHIKSLIYTVIWDLCPELIFEGYVYSLNAPLYRIVYSNGDSKYFLNDEEFNAWQNKHKGGKKYEVKRFKGLGEVSPEETKDLLADPAKRSLTQVTCEEVETMANLINDLMGKDTTPRKAFVEKYIERAGLYNAE